MFEIKIFGFYMVKDDCCYNVIHDISPSSLTKYDKSEVHCIFQLQGDIDYNCYCKVLLVFSIFLSWPCVERENNVMMVNTIYRRREITESSKEGNDVVCVP